MFLTGETLADQICQHAAGADLDECACTSPPHCLNLFGEPHGLSDLFGKRRPYGLRVAAIRLRCRVGVDRNLRRAKWDSCEERGEWNRCGANDLGMKCGSDIKASRIHAHRAKSLCRVSYGCGVAGHHNLVGSVVVGDDHRKAPSFDEPADLLDSCRHRAHRSVAGVAASAISAPRLRAIRSATSSLKTPAACSAMTSPKLCPPTATGAMPRARIMESRLKLWAPMPGCAHSVVVNSAACSARSSSVNAVFGQTTLCRSRSVFNWSARASSHGDNAGS